MRIYHVDAFTAQAFGGNPAGVCMLDDEGEAGWMKALATELNLPKTAFVRRAGAARFALRWIGADGEAQLCGHATLAAAHVLWQAGEVAADEAIAFDTLSGELRARRCQDGWIEIDFPAEVAAAEPRPTVVAALGVVPVWMGRNRLHFLVEVANESAVRALRPDFRRLAEVLAPARGVAVTARAAGDEPRGYDFVSRYFASPTGLDEDAATGSAHCSLGPYWAAKLGRSEMLAYQASPRGAWLRVRVAGDRVHVAGQAVTILRSQLAPRRAA